MIRDLICGLLRHKHGDAYIFITYRDGETSQSPRMDEWDANFIVANLITPAASWNGRPVASTRIVVP